MALVLVIVIGVLTFWACFNPFVGMLGLLGVNLINPGELFPLIGSLHVERIMVIVVFISAIMRNKLQVPPISRRMLAFWAAMFIAVPLAFWPGGAFSKSLDFGRIVLYHFLVLNLITSVDRFRTFLRVYVCLIGWVALTTLWGYAHGSFDANALRNGLERAQGLTSSGGDPNSLGVTLVSALPLMLLVAFKGKGTERLLAFAFSGIAVTAVVLTGSRTAIFTSAILILAFIATQRHRFMYVLVLIPVLALIWTLMPQQYKDRYVAASDVATGNAQDESYLNRIRAWKAGGNMFLNNPLTGVGPGQFPNASGSEFWQGRVKLWLQPHNLYVQLGAELGLVGIVTWLLFITSVLKTNLSLRKVLASQPELPAVFRFFPQACLFSLLALLVSGYSGHLLYRNTWFELAALTAACQLISAVAIVERDVAIEPSLDSASAEAS
jgi:O-antigen ligase